ncbi:MAG: hypothetical protein MK160_10065, partial [Rhodobacteraceae bacterium]|nr:hypothetical protein [Paracoccaceae bacterium]
PGQMGSYIGDVDDQGNLWTFSGNLRQAVVYDLSETTGDGSLVYQALSLPSMGIPTYGLADLAYHVETQTFYGVAHGGAVGRSGTLVAIDVSEVALGGQPTVTTQTIVGTIVEGETRSGIPAGAFGATIVDADGNVYIGANNTDHDLNGATANSGGFYIVVTGEDGQLYMELLSSAPQVGSNDGAMDTRGIDPFLNVDESSAVLIRAPELSVAIAEDDSVRLAAKGSQVTIDLLANDSVGEGDSISVTELNGTAVTTGMQLTLTNGEVVTYLGNGQIQITPASLPRDVVAELTYTIENSGGVTDTATVTIETSPVQGTAEDDSMIGFTDADGTEIDGSDGPDDIVLGYGGNDRIFSGLGDDDIYGGAGNDFVRAQAGNDLIYGEAGNDLLDGGLGIDTVYGGTGNDIYFIDQLGDIVSEEGGDGIDTVKSNFSYTLGSDLENLWLLLGTEALTATGNGLRNMVVGNENNNLIEGLAGNDNLIGGAGMDTIYGGTGDDKLHGSAGVDLLDGGTGNDKLHGGGGGDSAYGRDGNDTLCPGGGDDVMFGGAGDDLLSGNAGADTAYGGTGDDVYKLSDSFDTIIEYEGEGHDVVHARDSFSLSENVEDLLFFGLIDVVGAGNDEDNRIIGNAGDNTLSGNDGNDNINGRTGDDVLSGDAGNDRVVGGGGDDTIYGGSGNDNIMGATGNDLLIGGAGDDTLRGQIGQDTFEFTTGDGFDDIRGFDVTEDRLSFVGITEQDITWVGGTRAVTGTYGENSSILLRGIDLSMIDDIDFLFV